MQILQRLVSSYWPAISRADLAWIRGSQERLLHVVVRTYGLDRETAERQIRAFSDLIKLPASERQDFDSSVTAPHFAAQPNDSGMFVQRQQALPASQAAGSQGFVVEQMAQETREPRSDGDKRVSE